MMLELLVLELLHSVAANDPRLAQALGEEAQAAFGTRFLEPPRGPETEALPLNEVPAPPQHDQALKRRPPVDGQRQRHQQQELGGIAAEAINPGLNRVADLIDFIGEKADDLCAVGIREIAGAKSQCLAVQRAPHSSGDVESGRAAHSLRAP
jgi:hypothetical protein